MPKGLRRVRRVLEKKKARRIRAAYQIFARQRDKKIAFQKYISQNQQLRLEQRGRIWRRRNMASIGDNMAEAEEIIKQQFQKRIEEAATKAQEASNRKKGSQVKRKW
jgi:hypothetical protein